MKLRNKIKLSFVIITILPVVLTIVAITIISNIQMKSLESQYGVNVNGYSTMLNPSKLYSTITKEEIAEINATVNDEPYKLLDVEYLNSINKLLVRKFSFIAVSSDREIIYNGADDKALFDKIIRDKINVDEVTRSLVSVESKEYIVRIIPVNFTDTRSGNVYVITEYGKMFPQVRIMMIEIMIIMFLVIFATGAGLTLWIYRSVMRPLGKLEEAANNISEGNLDFKLENDSDDEFGELCEDFEEMRMRLKESAEEKLQSDIESKELISNISHDLKTPITTIKGYVEGIMDGVADTPEKMDKYIRTIYNKANDMDRLIGELTEYSRIDTNRVPYNFAKVNVAEYFEDCVDELRIDLEQRNITLNYINYLDESTVIIADVEQLKRVINNIISNSVKYIGRKQGIINIRINDEEDFVHIEIEDNGKGIAQKDLPLIFDRFYRTDASRNSNQGGSGIGLSIARKIIEEHSGRIWATSKEEMGTTMHMVIRKYMEVYGNGEENSDN